MNRNIITEADVPGHFDESNVAARGVPTTADDYLSRLLKYVPIEMISAYLIVAGIVESAYSEQQRAQRIALGVLLVLGLVATWFYSARVLKISRTSQLIMTVVAFTVWVFAIGGVFATTDWYQPWMGTIAVVIFGVAVRIIGLGPLPQPEPLDGPAT
jgi:hypothetical protein